MDTTNQTTNELLDLSQVMDDSAEGMTVVILPGVSVIHGGNILLTDGIDKLLDAPIRLEESDGVWREVQ